VGFLWEKVGFKFSIIKSGEKMGKCGFDFQIQIEGSFGSKFVLHILFIFSLHQIVRNEERN
jgi:hypothetical protein